MEDAAELARIGKYYAVEDMLTTEPKEKYGKVTLRQHYERIAVEGQEYDPYTSVLGKKN
jgi:divinyl chlorophyllide a 8-vinyl-reductase